MGIGDVVFALFGEQEIGRGIVDSVSLRTVFAIDPNSYERTPIGIMAPHGITEYTAEIGERTGHINRTEVVMPKFGFGRVSPGDVAVKYRSCFFGIPFYNVRIENGR
jgi:hypothetical protein